MYQFNHLQSKKKQDLRSLVLFSLLFSFTLLFAFTPIGSISFGVVTILVAHLPMILAFLVLPRPYAVSLAFLFGLCRLIRNTYDIQPLASFWFSPFAPVIGTDKGSWFALLINFLPLIAIVLYARLFSFEKMKFIQVVLWAAGATFLNTLIVLSSVYLIHREPLEKALGQQLLPLLVGIASTNGLLEVLFACLTIPFIYKGVSHRLHRFRS